MSSLFIALTVAALAAEEMTPKDAAASLKWSPESETVFRYEVRSDLTLTTSGAQSFDRATSVSVDYFRPNLPLRHFDLRMTLDCRFEQGRADRYVAACDIQDAQLDSNQSALRGASDVLAELEDRLQGSTVGLSLSELGRLYDVDPRWNGTRTWDHVAQELVVRAVSGFDLELPDDPTDRRWSQRRTSFSGTPTALGPLARAEIDHSRSPSIGNMTVVHSEGEMSHLVLGAARQPTRVGDARVSSVTAFDAEPGVPVQRSWAVHDLGHSPFSQEASYRLVSIDGAPVGR